MTSTALVGLSLLFVTLRNTTLGKTPLDEWSGRSIELHLTISNNHKRQISVPAGGMGTRNPWKRGTADLRLRLHGHWDRLERSCKRINYYFLRIALRFSLQLFTNDKIILSSFIQYYGYNNRENGTDIVER